MSEKPEHSIQNLFETFVYLRRQGASPDYALEELKKLRPTIAPDERKELAQMIRQWEKTEGIRHLPNPDAKIAPVTLVPAEESQSPTENQLTCPECKTPNPTDARYCYACGTLLTRAGTKQLPMSEADAMGTTFGSLSSLIFLVRNFEDTPIRVKVKELQELIIGRTASDSVIVPDIDLTKYEAQKLGVSRVHATLKRKDGVITISDMGSVNRTFINGDRVFPQEIRVLRDGDELRMGRLVMRVSFQRELRRIQ